MTNVDTAIALACKAHANQVDKAGQPYILHPLRLMLRFQGENERIVAVLHDVVEDGGGVTFDEIERIGFADVVVRALDSLTRRANESYEDFIARVSVNMLDRAVKVEDIKDNLDLTRLTILSDETWCE